MDIITQEHLWEYQMKGLIRKFVKEHQLEGLSAEMIQEIIWTKFPAEFGRAVLDFCADISGDELFEE